MGKGVTDLVSSLEENTLTKSKGKLRLRLSTVATFAEGLTTRMEKLQGIAWIGNLLLMISVFRK
jgi:hypothetical protein